MATLEAVAPAAPAAAPPGIQDYPPSPNPFLRSPLPPTQFLQPDALRQFYQKGNPQYRLLPLPPNASAANNSFAQSISKQNTASNVVSDLDLSLVMPKEFNVAGSPITTLDGEFDVTWAPELPHTFLKGIAVPGVLDILDKVGTEGTALSFSDTVSQTPTNAGEFFLFGANPFAISGEISLLQGVNGGNVSWTPITAIDLIRTATAVNNNLTSVTATVDLLANWAVALLSFGVVAGKAGQVIQSFHPSEGVTTSFPIAPTPGNTLFLIAIGANTFTGGPGFVTVTDTQGDAFIELANVQNPGSTANDSQPQVIVMGAENIAGGAGTITFHGSGGVTGFHPFGYVVEVANLAPVKGSVAFQRIIGSDILTPYGPLNNTDPAAPPGNTNVTWQLDTGNGKLSAYVPEGVSTINGETGAITLESLDGSVTITEPTSSTIDFSVVFPPSGDFNKSMSVDAVAMSDDYWVSVDSGTYDQWLPSVVT
jgi:hypothetical protein